MCACSLLLAPPLSCSKLTGSDQEVFDRIFEDRLGVLNFLKPGKSPVAALAATGAAADEPGAAAAAVDGDANAEGGRAGDANRAAPKPALKSTSLFDDDEFLGNEDNEALGLGIGGGGFAAGMGGMATAGFGAGMGLGLAAGIDAGAIAAAAAAAPNFMHDDDAHDDFDDSLGLGQLGQLQPMPAATGSFLQQQQQHGALQRHSSLQHSGSLQSNSSLQPSGSLPLAAGISPAGDMYSPPAPGVGPLTYSPLQTGLAAAAAAAPPPPPDAAAVAASRPRRGVRFSDDGSNAPAAPAAAAGVGSSRHAITHASPADPGEPQPMPPPPPMQQQQAPPPPPPPQQQQQQQQHGGSTVLATVLSKKVKCSKLVPWLTGLLEFVNKQRGMKSIKVFLDASITEKTPDRVSAAGICVSC
jgi:hypothetical protein